MALWPLLSFLGQVWRLRSRLPGREMGRKPPLRDVGGSLGLRTACNLKGLIVQNVFLNLFESWGVNQLPSLVTEEQGLCCGTAGSDREWFPV